MKIENTLKRLSKDGYKVYRAEFANQDFWFVNGVGLVDLVNGVAKDTSAKYQDVVKQVAQNRSHIQTIDGNKRELTSYYKMGYKNI